MDWLVQNLRVWPTKDHWYQHKSKDLERMGLMNATTQFPGESNHDRWKFCNTPSSCRPKNTNAKSDQLRGLIRHMLAGLHTLHLQHSVLHQVQQQPRHKGVPAPAIPDRSWYKGGLLAWVWGQLSSWGRWTSSILSLVLLKVTLTTYYRRFLQVNFLRLTVG